MIWNKKKDGAENPGAETPAAQTAKAPVLFLQKNWKWLVPVVCVVIAGGVFLLKPKSASTTAVDPSYLEASPEVRDVSNTLSGTGTLNPANTYTVKSLVEGKVLTGEFEEGDVLDEGSILYTLDSSDASTNFEKAEIAMQQAGQPVRILHGQRPVEPHLHAQRGDTGCGRVRSGHDGCNVTGEYTQCQKHQYRQSHQCRYEQQQPFGHESHIIPPWKSAIAAVPSG